jgi:uncharacterized membrane protein
MIKILRYMLALLLFVAGIAHFIQPERFIVAMPPYIPFHYPVIILTGIIEIILAIGLLVPMFIKISAFMTAIYFVALILAHIHVSINNIEMFGINSPALLWSRTAFQGVLIYWAFIIGKKQA